MRYFSILAFLCTIGFLGYTAVYAAGVSVPVCTNAGTKSEGWNTTPFTYDTCKKCKAVCLNIGTSTEGFYSSCNKTLIKYVLCGSKPVSGMLSASLLQNVPQVKNTLYAGAKITCESGKSTDLSDISLGKISADAWKKKADSYCKTECNAQKKCGVKTFAVIKNDTVSIPSGVVIKKAAAPTGTKASSINAGVKTITPITTPASPTTKVQGATSFSSSSAFSASIINESLSADLSKKEFQKKIQQTSKDALAKKKEEVKSQIQSLNEQKKQATADHKQNLKNTSDPEQKKSLQESFSAELKNIDDQIQKTTKNHKEYQAKVNSDAKVLNTKYTIEMLEKDITSETSALKLDPNSFAGLFVQLNQAKMEIKAEEFAQKLLALQKEKELALEKVTSKEDIKQTKADFDAKIKALKASQKAELQAYRAQIKADAQTKIKAYKEAFKKQ